MRTSGHIACSHPGQAIYNTGTQFLQLTGRYSSSCCKDTSSVSMPLQSCVRSVVVVRIRRWSTIVQKVFGAERRRDRVKLQRRLSKVKAIGKVIGGSVRITQTG